MPEAIYYIIYDQKRVHWFIKKENTNERNLEAIQRKLFSNKNLIDEEVVLSKSNESRIKTTLLGSLDSTLKIIREENPHRLPIYFPP